MIYSNNTFDITNNIATYTRRDFKSVFDTTSNKWYMLNNLGNYEEYGIYGTSLDDTKYVGKLVKVDGHEYEWTGTEWNDLGIIIIDKYLSLTGTNNNFSNWPRFVTDLHLKNTYTIEVKCKPISMGGEWRQLWGSYDDNNMDHNGFAWLKSGNGATRYSQAFWNYNVGSRV